MAVISAGDTVKVPNQFTRPGGPKIQATVVKVDPPTVWVRFYWGGKWRNSKHNISEVER